MIGKIFAFISGLLIGLFFGTIAGEIIIKKAVEFIGGLI